MTAVDYFTRSTSSIAREDIDRSEAINHRFLPKMSLEQSKGSSSQPATDKVANKKEATMATVIRITRHAIDTDRLHYLQAIYGDDVRVVTEDIPYGDDPLVAVRALIERTEKDGDKVVAIEAQAPFPVTIKLVDRRRDLGVALIRAQFARDEGGRAIVVGQDGGGRDLLKFSHYEELERIEFQVRRLGS